MPIQSDKIKVGQPAPDFTLDAISGEPISLKNYRGKKHVVIVFLRGFL